MKANTKFKPTDAQIAAATSVFKAKAWKQTIEPVVEAYENAILAEMKPTSKYSFKIITDRKRSYEMSDAEFETYWNRCKQARDAAKLYVEKDDYCPLLVAERLENEAENALIDAMESVTHLSHEQVMCGADGMKNRATLVELTLKLMASYVGANKKIKL